MAQDSNSETYQDLRVVSLLPSITEVLASLIGSGDGDRVKIVGVTHECDYPKSVVQHARIVTTSEISRRPSERTQAEIHEKVCGSLTAGHSLYGLDKQVLRELNPDVIFTQSLCDVCAVSYPVVQDTCAKVLAESSPKIISMEPNNLEDILETFLVAGEALGRQEAAKTVVAGLRSDLDFIQQVVQEHNAAENNNTSEKPRPKVAFLEWNDPLFSGGHWIADIMEIAGCDYDMCAAGERSAAVSDQVFCAMDPDYILVGPCGMDLDRTVVDTLRMYHDTSRSWSYQSMRAVRNGNVFCLDGNSYYARPGPRIVQGCGLIAACVHGEAVAKRLGERLAPLSGMKRMTVDMYSNSNTTEGDH